MCLIIYNTNAIMFWNICKTLKSFSKSFLNNLFSKKPIDIIKTHGENNGRNSYDTQKTELKL